MRSMPFGIVCCRWARGTRAACAIAALSSALASGCRVPREVHEPRPYPQIKLESSAIRVVVLDSRPPVATPSEQRLVLPGDFEANAQRRLTSLLAGHGPSLHVRVQLGAADAVDVLDARGEMTRVVVTLDFEVTVASGVQLRTAQSQSSSDLPRDEATPEEINFVLGATALDAFDRYWANPDTLTRLNRDLSAYTEKHPESVSQAR
jgi:hypothetical protein